MRSRLLACLLPTACLLYSQQTPPVGPQDLCRIEGRAVDSVTGEPVSGVLLFLRPLPYGDEYRAGTDSAGRFSFRDVDPGTYTLSMEGPSGSGEMRLTLSAGKVVDNLEFKVSTRGAIAGTVVDDEGNPVSKVSLIAVPAGDPLTRREGYLTGATTNAAGEFRVPTPRPGRYLLMANVFGADRKPDELPLLMTYYPSAADEAGAIPLRVGPGEELSGITVVLRRGRLHRVRGTVVSLSDSLKLTEVSVQLTSRRGGMRVIMAAGSELPRSGGTAPGAGYVAEDGSFDVATGGMGSFQLTAARKGDRRKVLGSVRVEVTGDDVTGVVLVIGEPLTIPGTATVEGKPEIDLGGASITLRSSDRTAMPAPEARLSAGGAFKLAEVPLASYEVNADGLPEGAYLKSVRFGGAEIIGSALDLSRTAAPLPLEVLVSPNGATVEGTVEDDEKPSPGAWVCLIPDPPRPESTYRVRSQMADRIGRFRLTGVAPGDYRLFGFQETEPGALTELELFRPYESEAVKLTVREGEQKQVEVTVLKPIEAR